MIAVGRRVEVRPAFSSETGDRSIWDEIAGCEATILRVFVADDTCDVQITNGDEVNVHVGRLKFGAVS